MNYQVRLSLFFYCMSTLILAGMENPFSSLDPVNVARDGNAAAMISCLCDGCDRDDLNAALVAAVEAGNLETTEVLLNNDTPLDNFQALLLCALESKNIRIAVCLHSAMRVRKKHVAFEGKFHKGVCFPVELVLFGWEVGARMPSIDFNGNRQNMHKKNVSGYWSFHSGDDFYIVMNRYGGPNLTGWSFQPAFVILGKHFPLLGFLRSVGATIVFPEIPRLPRKLRRSPRLPKRAWSAPVILQPRTPVGSPPKAPLTSQEEVILPLPGFEPLVVDSPGGAYDVVQDEWDPAEVYVGREPEQQGKMGRSPDQSRYAFVLAKNGEER